MINTNRIGGYLKMDLYRVTHSVQGYLAIPLICALLYTSAWFSKLLYAQSSVMELIWNTLYDVMPMLSFVIAAGVYSNSLLEDIERKSIYQFIVRGNLNQFLLSRFLVNFLVCVFVIVAGGMLFAFSWRMGHPWIQDADKQGSIYEFSDLSQILHAGHYIIYIVLILLQYSLLGALLSGIAMLFSVLTGSRSITLISPLFVVYLLQYFTAMIDPESTNICHVFNAVINANDPSVRPLILASAIAAASNAVEFLLLRFVIRRELL